MPICLHRSTCLCHESAISSSMSGSSAHLAVRSSNDGDMKKASKFLPNNATQTSRFLGSITHNHVIIQRHQHTRSSVLFINSFGQHPMHAKANIRVDIRSNQSASCKPHLRLASRICVSKIPCDDLPAGTD